MCTHRTWITLRDGRKIAVNCGKCKACQQEKANHRATMINRHGKPGEICLFCTFTYMNKFLPYIDKNDRIYFFRKDGKLLPHVALYRNAHIFRWYDRHQRFYHEKIVEHRDIIDFIPVIDFDCDGMLYDNRRISDLDYILIKDLTRYGDDKFNVVLNQCSMLIQKLPYVSCKDGEMSFNDVSVIYYKDIQLFYKRLFINLKREGYDTTKLSYWNCSEYGGTYSRAHFHSLVWCPKSDYLVVKRAINKSWQMCNYYQRDYKQVQLAKAPARYVAGYLNKSNSLPTLFREKWFKPRCSSSRDFGFDFKEFKFESVLTKILAHNLSYTAQVVRKGGAVELATFQLPRYVINKYFPKITGYNRLTRDEMVECLSLPTRFREKFRTNERGFRERFDDLINISVRAFKHHGLCIYEKVFCNFERQFNRLRKIAHDLGFSFFDYVILYYQAWTVYSSNVLKNAHVFVQHESDYFNGFYDNIIDYLTGDVQSLFLDSIISEVHTFVTDINIFPSILSKDNKLIHDFDDLEYKKNVADVLLTMNSISFNDL